MTDEHFDRRVRDADPYRPEVIAHLGGAAQDLLEEILSAPTLEPIADPPGKRVRARRHLMSGLATASVAAAILAVVFTVSIAKPDQPGDREVSPSIDSSSAAPGTVSYSAMVLKAAEENPRLLINQPGWKATTVYGFAEKEGTIAFTNGKRQLSMNWYPADQYGSYHDDRLNGSKGDQPNGSKPESVKVDRWPGDLFRYGASDFAVMLRPRDGSFVELRTGGAWTRSEFDRVLATVIRVDARTWLAALPAEIVTPERAQEQAAKVLVGVPLPRASTRPRWPTRASTTPTSSVPR
ncbi:hypothetical protein GCM10027614_69120 [Micromonospora vulcania]